MERAIQKIFRTHFETYSSTRSLCPREYRAAHNFSVCRTARLGGHIERCPEGHVTRVHYNSCKHRSCAQCCALSIERWLEKQKARLLQCPHHHIIFTFAHELIPLWMHNRSSMMNLFFRAVRHALLDFLLDTRYLGATPGMLCAFHSWGRDLSIHPHIHCLVTDGGLSGEGHWLEPKRSHFLPVKALMLKFRGAFCAGLHEALDAGELMVPARDTLQRWHRIIKQTQSKKWNVNLRERYDHGQGVATYLARYVRGGPTSSHQFELNQNGIRFQYYDHRLNAAGKREHKSFLTLTPEQFFQRYLQHVPEKRRQVVRHYGLYAAVKIDALNRARLLHHQAPVKPVDPVSWQDFIAKVAGEDCRYCPTCRRLLRTTQILPKQQSPPL